MTVRVLICNRIRLYAEGLRRLFEEDEKMMVTGVLSGERDFGMEGSDADVVITDSANYAFLAGRAKRILLIRDDSDRHLLPPFGDLKEMVAQGLVGILDVATDLALLRKAVEKVHEGELWLDHRIIRNSLQTPESNRAHLSRRETEIMHFIREGLSNKQIAARLFISEQTVKSHCNHLFKKFGVSSRLQLALSASSEE